MTQNNPYACYNCGHPVTIYRHCKIVCPNCGFMLDCSDLDVGGEVKRAQTRLAHRSPPTDKADTAGSGGGVSEASGRR